MMEYQNNYSAGKSDMIEPLTGGILLVGGILLGRMTKSGGKAHQEKAHSGYQPLEYRV